MDKMYVTRVQTINTGEYNSVKIGYVSLPVEYDPETQDHKKVFCAVQEQMSEAISQAATPFKPYIVMRKIQSNGLPLPQVIEMFEGTKAER